MAKTWVVYRRPLKDDPVGVPGVCSQAEWEAMERATPGILTLVRAGITNEGEAERLARAAAAQSPPRADTKPRAQEHEVDE